MEITTTDNFFPVDFYNKILEESISYAWNFFRVDCDHDKYWTKTVYGNNFSKENPKFLDNFTEPTIEKAWQYFSDKFNVSKDKLYGVYLNALHSGLEAYPHIDANKSNYVTVICYLCENWNAYWSGATNFYTGVFSENPADIVFYTNEIQKSVLPKYNRIVIFNSNIIHGVTPVSKSFKGLRKTLMFKLKDIDYKDLMTRVNNGDT